MLIRTTVTGGDAYPKVKLDDAGQLDRSGINVGDTVVVAPGNMRSVVASPAVSIMLYEAGSATKEELGKALASGQDQGVKIEVMKGKLLHGDVFAQEIGIDLQSTDLKKYDLDLNLLAFNRGEKAFRGDLAVYDLLPPELLFKSADAAVKYNDHQARKNFVSGIPIVSVLARSIDNFSRTDEAVDMVHESLGEIHRYTFRRLVLDPGQAVGFTLHLRYLPPSGQELLELRQAARPLTTTFQQ
jgi:hypothetical protein